MQSVVPDRGTVSKQKAKLRHLRYQLEGTLARRWLQKEQPEVYQKIQKRAKRKYPDNYDYGNGNR